MSTPSTTTEDQDTGDIGREITLASGANLAVVTHDEISTLLRFTTPDGKITHVRLTEEATRGLIALLISDKRFKWVIDAA